eukprot:911119-Amorphochlora_amoeboformis.AAC.1
MLMVPKSSPTSTHLVYSCSRSPPPLKRLPLPFLERNTPTRSNTPSLPPLYRPPTSARTHNLYLPSIAQPYLSYLFSITQLYLPYLPSIAQPYLPYLTSIAQPYLPYIHSIAQPYLPSIAQP